VRVFVVAPPGLESLVADEMEGLDGVSRLRIESGGVGADATLEGVLRINVWSRIGTRVLIRLASFAAHTKEQLTQQSSRVDLDPFVPAGATIGLSASARSSRLYHTGAIAECVSRGLGVTFQPNADVTLYCRVDDDNVTLSIDATGDRLHQRGVRVDGGKAPIRETLAAAILRLARYDPSRPLVDPMCGSGTFCVEGARVLLRSAPGKDRQFACEAFPCMPRLAIEAVRKQSSASRRTPLEVNIFGFDRDASAVARATTHAEQAGVDDAIRFQVRALDVPLEGDHPLRSLPPGLVVANPPYGVRLSHPAAVGGLYDALCTALRKDFPGWRAAILAPRPDLVARLRLAHLHATTLRNGGLRVRLAIGEIPGHRTRPSDVDAPRDCIRR